MDKAKIIKYSCLLTLLVFVFVFSFYGRYNSINSRYIEDVYTITGKELIKKEDNTNIYLVYCKDSAGREYTFELNKNYVGARRYDDVYYLITEGEKYNITVYIHTDLKQRPYISQMFKIVM